LRARFPAHTFFLLEAAESIFIASSLSTRSL
jgi:hypothetical protein